MENILSLPATLQALPSSKSKEFNATYTFFGF